MKRKEGKGMINAIKNSEFKNIKKIADFFYDKVGVIPALSEKNFDTYERPTNEEILDLKNNPELFTEQFLS